MSDWKLWPVIPDAPADTEEPAAAARTIKKKPKAVKAPTRLFALPNPDKRGHESYAEMVPGENLARYPGPFRCCVIGRVNSGKSLIAKHILMAHQAHKPQFKYGGVRRH